MSDSTTIDPAFYDAELRRLNAHLRAAAGVRPGDRVLDIGCGGGETTRDAGRAAVDGSATGVDTSAPMLEHARRRTEADGLRNVTYERGDAQIHPFPRGHFDLCISRFGAMFFTEPVAAFANIGRSMRGDARLVLLAWQDAEHNEWVTAPREALLGPNPPALAAANGGPFSLAAPTTTRAMLTSAGFVDIGFTDLREPVFYGATRDAAYDAMLRLGHGRDLVGSAADHARTRLHAMLGDHETGAGVHFDSAAWLITARRP